jgi:hypothetical protein
MIPWRLTPEGKMVAAFVPTLYAIDAHSVKILALLAASLAFVLFISTI